MRVLLAALLLCAATGADAARWLKIHSLSPYKTHLNSELTVKDLAAALPRLASAVEKEGGRFTQPLELMAAADGVQQVSVAISEKGAKRLAKSLRALGEMPEPRRAPARGVPDAAEIRSSLAVLLKERADNAALYARLPAAAQAVDEIIAHLTDAQAAAADEKSAVLWNLTVRRR